MTEPTQPLTEKERANRASERAAACVVCNDPTDTTTCSRECQEDLALAQGHITDYSEENHMDTQKTVTLPPMTDAERQAYLVITGIATHPHEPGIHCLSCRQAAINIVHAVAPTICYEERRTVHQGIVDAFAADPLGEAPNRVSVIEHSRHMVTAISQRLDLYRLPESWMGELPAGYVEAS